MEELTKDEQRELVQVAIREVLMGYYKQTDSGRLLTIENGITLREPSLETQYQYQRRLRDVQVPRLLRIGGVTLAELTKQPNVFTFAVKPDATAELALLTAHIKKFFKNYLPSVAVKVNPDASSEFDDSVLAKVKVSFNDCSRDQHVYMTERLRRYTSSMWEDQAAFAQYATEVSSFDTDDATEADGSEAPQPVIDPRMPTVTTTDFYATYRPFF